MDDSELYAAARRVADIFYANITHDSQDRTGPLIQDTRQNLVTPSGWQTEEGLYLNFYYGTPSQLWTPWGTWIFAGGRSYANQQQKTVFVAKVMEQLRTRLFRPKEENELGVYGPTYALLAVEGIVLPEPRLRSQEAYTPTDAARAQWDNLTRIYTSS